MALRINTGGEPESQNNEVLGEIEEPIVAIEEDDSVHVDSEVVEEDYVIETEVNSSKSETRVGDVEIINYLPRVPWDVRGGFRDFTDKEWAIALEDFKRGYAPLPQEDWEKYQIPEEPIAYRTREKLSANCLKVSAGMVGKWVQGNTNKHRQMYPNGYLQDEFGFTPQAVAVFRNMMRYTCKRRFKANEQGVIEWSRLDRDTSPMKDPEYSEENPDYILCSLYWEKREEMWLDYLDLMDWIEDYRKRQSLSQSSFQPEMPQVWGDNAARSEARAREELAKQEIVLFWGRQLDHLKDQIVEMARDKAQEALAEGFEAISEVVKNAEPEVPTEGDDFWSEDGK
jgi:hypothetical protein